MALSIPLHASLGPSAATDSALYAVVEHATRESICQLEKDWHGLVARCEGSAVFQAFDLCLAWLDAYAFGEEPTHRARVLAFRDPHDRLMAVVPLAQKTSGLVSMAEWIGDPLVQYGDILLDPLCDHRAIASAFRQALIRFDADGLHLRNVRADARIAKILDLSATRVGDQREALMIDLTRFDTPDAYFATLSKSARTNRKRKRRALAKLGELTFDVVAAGPEARALCDLALEWKIAWLDSRGESSRAFMDPRALDALKVAISRPGDANPFRLFVQSINGAPATIEIGLVGPLGNAMFIASYDPELDAVSPGKVRIESTICFGFEHGWQTYDMLPPSMDYKKSWTNHALPVADHVIPATHLAGLYRSVYLRGLRPGLKSLWHRLPQTTRSTLLSWRS